MLKKNNLRGFRATFDLTQEQIADSIGLTRESYCRKESTQNFSEVQKANILEFAKTFDKDITLEDLFNQ